MTHKAFDFKTCIYTSVVLLIFVGIFAFLHGSFFLFDPIILARVKILGTGTCFRNDPGDFKTYTYEHYCTDFLSAFSPFCIAWIVSI